MPPHRSHIVALGCLVALVAVFLTRIHFGIAAVWAVSWTIAIPRGGFALAGLAALPVLLAAMPRPDALAMAIPNGPVTLFGSVTLVRRDYTENSSGIEVTANGLRYRAYIKPALFILPGDRIWLTGRGTEACVPDGAPSVQAAASACRIEPGAQSLPRACTEIRLALEARLHALLPLNEALLVSNLVLGSGTRVPTDLAAAHRATGLSHLLAVSGAHAAMLSMLLGLQSLHGGRRRRIGTVHLTIAMMLLFSYGAITGFEPPVFRALASYALAAYGMRTGRKLGVMTGLAWPALFSCLLAPDGILGASFWLSYAAVGGLWLAGPPRADTALERFVLCPIRASFWATAMTAPWTLGWFGQLAPWTVLLTPILAPLVAALLFLGLAASIGALLVPMLGTVCAVPLSILARTYANAVQLADSLPATPIHAFTTPSMIWLALAAITGLTVAAVLRTRGSALLGCAIAALPHFLPAAPPDAPSLQLFAIGHGQCCLVTSNTGRNIVIDCGSQQNLLLPARRLEQAMHRRCIDVLVLTHADRDHTGTVQGLCGRLPILRAILPAAMRDHPAAHALALQHCKITFLLPGERDAGEPGITVAAPRVTAATDNDASLWTTVAFVGLSVQLPGDAQQRGIEAAIAEHIAGRADVLVLPHHGRPEVAIDTLLDVVQPLLCLVSNQCGEGNSVQGGTVVRRGVPTFATGECGSILLIGGAEPRIQGTQGLLLPKREKGD